MGELQAELTLVLNDLRYELQVMANKMEQLGKKIEDGQGFLEEKFLNKITLLLARCTKIASTAAGLFVVPPHQMTDREARRAKSKVGSARTAIKRKTRALDDKLRILDLN